MPLQCVLIDSRFIKEHKLGRSPLQQFNPPCISQILISFLSPFLNHLTFHTPFFEEPTKDCCTGRHTIHLINCIGNFLKEKCKVTRKKVENVLRLKLAIFTYKWTRIKDFFYLWSYNSRWPRFQVRNDWGCLVSKEKLVLNPVYSIRTVFLTLSNLFNPTSYSQLITNWLQFIMMKVDWHCISNDSNWSSLEVFIAKLFSNSVNRSSLEVFVVK